MKPEPPTSKKDFEKAMKTFERLPAGNKELEILKDQVEKTTGRESLTLDKSIRERSREAHPSL